MGWNLNLPKKDRAAPKISPGHTPSPTRTYLVDIVNKSDESELLLSKGVKAGSVEAAFNNVDERLVCKRATEAYGKPLKVVSTYNTSQGRNVNFVPCASSPRDSQEVVFSALYKANPLTK